MSIALVERYPLANAINAFSGLNTNRIHQPYVLQILFYGCKTGSDLVEVALAPTFDTSL